MHWKLYQFPAFISYSTEESQNQLHQTPWWKSSG